MAGPDDPNVSVKRGTGTVEASFYDGDERRFTLYRPSELRGTMRRAGFDVESVSVEETGANDWLQVNARA